MTSTPPSELVALCLGTVGLGLWFYLAHSILWPALRTGHFQSHGVAYSRERQPFMYWLGISFWLFILAMFALTEVIAVTRLLKRI